MFCPGEKINKNLYRTLHMLLFLLLILPCLIFIILKPFGGYFLAEELAYLTNTLKISPHLPRPIDVGIPGNDVLIVIFHRILNVPIKDLQYFPIHLALTTLTIFTLGKKLYLPTSSALLLAAIYSYETAFGAEYLSIYTHSLGSLFYFLFILLLLIFAKNGETKFLFLMFVIFIANHFVDYTAESWMIATLFFFSLAMLIICKKIPFFYFFLSLCVLFFGFRREPYGYIVDASPRLALDAVLTFLLQMRISNKPVSSYEYVPISPYPLFAINVLYYLFTFAPIVAGIVVTCAKLFKSRGVFDITCLEESRLPVLPCLKFSIIMTAITEIIIYTFRGLFRLGYVVLFLPILATIYILELLKEKSSKNKILILFLSVLLFLNMSEYFLKINHGLFPDVSKTTVTPSTQWLFIHLPQNYAVILSDLHTLGKYDLEAASIGVSFKQQTYNLTIYDQLVNSTYFIHKSNFLSSTCNFIVIDKADKPVLAPEWTLFEPLSQYIENIDGNPNVFKVYDDGAVNIYGTMPA